MFEITNKDARQGIFFGINSGIITTVGLIAGMSQTTTNPIFIVISVLSIAISDGVGEGYGIFLSKKAELTKDTGSGPLQSLIWLFISKFLIVVSFLIPLIFYWNLKYYTNLIWPVVFSIIVLTIIDCRLSKIRNEPLTKYLIPHYVLLAVVVILTKGIGVLLSKFN